MSGNPPDSAPPAAPARFGITRRAVVVGIALTIVAAVWVAQVEMILHTAEISESVPLIASLAGLLALVLYNRTLQSLEALARRNCTAAGAALIAGGAVIWLLHLAAGGGLRTVLAVGGSLIAAMGLATLVSERAAAALTGWQLSRREVLAVYCFLTLSALMMSAKVSGYVVPEMTIYSYFGFQNPSFQEAGAQVPNWLILKDPEVVRMLYEGSDRTMPGEPGGPAGVVVRATEGLWWPLMQVPWLRWAVPLGAWLVIMGLVFTAGLCLMALVKRYWVEKERLSFPLVMIPLELSTGAVRGVSSAMLGSWNFWVGFMLSGLFTFYVIMHAVNPSLPVFRPYYSLAPLFREHPWNAVQNASVDIRPEILGLSYFMNSDITLTIWVTTFAVNLLAVLTRALGYETRSFPRPFDQGIGAYVMLAAALAWSAREWLGKGLSAAVSGAATGEARRMAALWLGLLGSLGALLAIMVIAGMKLWAAAYLFGIILVFWFVYGRARAETGVPHPSPYPMDGHMQVLEYIGGPKAWAGGATPALLGTMYLLGRGYTVTGAGAQIENLKIADVQDIRPAAMTWLTLAAPVVGLLVALVMRLAVSYHYGLNFLEGGGVEGGYAVIQMHYAARDVVDEAALGVGRSVAAGNCAAFGAVVTLALVLLRRAFLRFPLHPLGFGLAMIRLRQFWAPVLVTWLAKTLLLKLGGARSYRQAAPFFLGIAIGHYLFAGIGLGCLAAAFPWLLEKIEVINFD